MAHQELTPLTDVMLQRLAPDNDMMPALADGAASETFVLALPDANDMRYAFEKLAYNDILSGRVAGVALDNAILTGVGAETLWRLQRIGAVAISNGGADGQLVVAANPEFRTWSYRVGVTEPASLLRMSSPLPSLKKSKLELIMYLHSQGWEPSDDLPAYVQDGERRYERHTKRPTSYFVALAESPLLFEKGVNRILHRMSDRYYKCLLQLQGQALVELLREGSLEDQVDAWFAKRLKDGGIDGVDSDDDPVVEPLPLADQAPDNQGMLAPLAERPDEWPRMLVHTGPGSLQVKIYFDHFTSSASTRAQRSYCVCTQHNCTKWKNRFGDKLSFAAYMYQWSLDGQMPAISDKVTHLRHEPSQADQDRIKPLLVMDCF